MIFDARTISIYLYDGGSNHQSAKAVAEVMRLLYYRRKHQLVMQNIKNTPISFAYFVQNWTGSCSVKSFAKKSEARQQVLLKPSNQLNFLYRYD